MVDLAVLEGNEPMTTADKQKVMWEECDSRPTCTGCPLEGKTTISCYADERDAEINYPIMISNDNPYWKNVTAIAEKQRKKGLETYGEGLEANNADVMTRIQYIEEELVDSLMYLEWLKDAIQKGK